MQHQTIISFGRRKTMIACLGLLLLLTTNVTVAASIPEARGITPAVLIPRYLIMGRQTYDITEYYEQECGRDFVDCGGRQCCKAGQECLVGTQSGELWCKNLNDTQTPAPTQTPSVESNSVPVGGIVGGVIGALVVIVAACIFYLLHRRNNPPATPAIPHAPFPDSTHMLQAKYLPPSDTASCHGDHWQGSYLYNSRNRTGSVTASVASTRNCVSPTPCDNTSPGGTVTYQTLGKVETDCPAAIELPDSTILPMELPAEGLPEETPQPPPPPPAAHPDRVVPKPPSAFLQYLKKNRHI